MREFFAPAHRSGEADRIAERWRTDLPLPVPTGPRFCADCIATDDVAAPLIIRLWKPFLRYKGGSKNPPRCDVSLKCTRCSRIYWYGIVISEKQYAAASALGFGDREVLWREGYEALGLGDPDA